MRFLFFRTLAHHPAALPAVFGVDYILVTVKPITGAGLTHFLHGGTRDPGQPRILNHMMLQILADSPGHV